MKNYKWVHEPIWRVHVRIIVVWAILVLLAYGLGTMVGNVARGATVTYGVTVPYDRWRIDNVTFQVFEIESQGYTAKNWQITTALQIQQTDISGTYAFDGRVAQGRERLLQGLARLHYRKGNWRLHGGFGLRTGHRPCEYGVSKVLGHFGITCDIGDLSIGFSHYSDPLQSHDKGRNFLTFGWRF